MTKKQREELLNAHKNSSLSSYLYSEGGSLSINDLLALARGLAMSIEIAKDLGEDRAHSLATQSLHMDLKAIE